MIIMHKTSVTNGPTRIIRLASNLTLRSRPGKNIPPLKAVGFEGLFGFMIACLLLIPLYFIKVNRDGQYVPIEDAYDAVLQIAHNWKTGN